MTEARGNIRGFFAAFALVALPVAMGLAQSQEQLVPLKVHQKFLIENPGTKATWKTAGELFVAQYVNPLNNMGYVIVYDTAGTVIRREKELEPQDYPAIINDYFEQHHPGEGYIIWSSTDTVGNIHFYTQHREKVLRFDRSGQPLKDLRYGIRRPDSLSSPPHR
jgi:hypothetical protein